MKRTCDILISMVLSTVIIMLSAGVAFVNCSHSGLSSIAMVSVIDSEGGDDCCQGCTEADTGECGCMEQTSCLTVTVLKLAPSNNTQPASTNFYCPSFAIPFHFGTRSLSDWEVALLQCTNHTIDKDRGSPSRSILSLNHILRL